MRLSILSRNASTSFPFIKDAADSLTATVVGVKFKKCTWHYRLCFLRAQSSFVSTSQTEKAIESEASVLVTQQKEK
jgi:hypothetical protein